MNSRSILGAVLLLVGSTVALSQESEPEQDTGKFRPLLVELSAWNARPDGLDYFPASRLDPTNPFGTTLLSPVSDNTAELYARFGFQFKGNMGKVLGTYFDQSQDDVTLSDSRPGEYVFGELLAHPLFAGFKNDGKADGFDASFGTSLTDIRIDYYRKAFEVKRLWAEWFVGLRRVRHQREQRVTYTALVTDLPPLLPPLSGPRPDLDPSADIASLASKYSGRGIGGGMDFHAPIIRKFEISGGFNLSVLRGKTDSLYTSRTAYYVLTMPGQPAVILDPPYSEFGEVVVNPMTGEITPLADDIQQRQLQLGLTSQSTSTTSSVLEGYLEFRYHPMPLIDVFFGFRNIRYDNVGVDLYPQIVTSPGGPTLDDQGRLQGINLQTLTEVDRSATYEGYYLGFGIYF